MSRPQAEQRFERLQALLGAARGLPAAERSAYLAGAEPNDAGLRAEVEALLAEESRASLAIDPSLRRLGHCTLLRPLGDGGMGAVYEARQEPPGRIVAVKVLRAALAGERGRRRLEHEARVLARLRHPGIAQLYETGTYTDAAGEELPYFVMEHVRGARTLVDYAAEHALDMRERLRLFMTVCDAVQFGHTKGVIHRDLKPGNVLVNDEGQAKVIDFGIARSTEPETGEHVAPRTETGLLLGTLPYMSPEQVAGVREDVDTRSDVYALGVLLYQLLTGRLPYDLDGLGVVSAAERIRSAAPLHPSRFAPATAGDVSVILFKALNKEPAQRYASAAALGHDIERYLSLLPIHAHPPSLVYQLRLFARRHRLVFGLAVAMGVILVSAFGASTWFAAREATQRREAERQRERAERLLEETRDLVPWLLRDLSGELARLPGNVLARSRLAARLGAHLDALAVTERDHPNVLDAAVQARTALGDLLGGLGDGNLGRRGEAVAQYTLALDLLERRAAQGGDALRSGMSRAALLLGRAAARKDLGELESAEADVQVAADLARRPPLADAPAAAPLRVRILTRQGDLDWLHGRHEAALAAYAAVLAQWEAAPLSQGADAREGRALAQVSLVQSLLELGRHDEAAAHLHAVDVEVQFLEGLKEPDAAQLYLLYFLHDNVGRGLLEAGRPGEAAERFAGALRAAERRRGLDTRNVEAQVHVHNAHMLLGRAAFDRGRFTEALEHYDRALPLSEHLSAGRPATSDLLWDRRLALTYMGRAHLALGRYAQAERALLQALPLALAREEALADLESGLGLRDVYAQLYNLSLRRWRQVDAVRPLLGHLAHALTCCGVSDALAQVSAGHALLSSHLLRTARARLVSAREALARPRSAPEWGEGHARDLARLDAGLAALDDLLATYR